MRRRQLARPPWVGMVVAAMGSTRRVFDLNRGRASLTLLPASGRVIRGARRRRKKSLPASLDVAGSQPPIPDRHLARRSRRDSRRVLSRAFSIEGGARHVSWMPSAVRAPCGPINQNVYSQRLTGTVPVVPPPSGPAWRNTVREHPNHDDCHTARNRRPEWYSRRTTPEALLGRASTRAPF